MRRKSANWDDIAPYGSGLNCVNPLANGTMMEIKRRRPAVMFGLLSHE